MSTLEPTPYLCMDLMQDRVEDLSWALERAIEMMVETAGIAATDRILHRLRVENAARVAQRNVDSTPPSV